MPRSTSPLEWSSVGVVDAAGQIVREAKVRSEREALVAFFAESGLSILRIGLEAGPLSQWLYAGLVEARLHPCGRSEGMGGILVVLVRPGAAGVTRRAGRSGRAKKAG